MRIVQVQTVTPQLVAAFARLMPQLEPATPPPTAAELGAIVAAPSTTLLIAQDDGPDAYIAGALTLVCFRTPTGTHAWIEDVVVDAAYRRQGIGAVLVRAALDRAREAGARAVDLTSRPARAAANRLYQRLGFVRRETNVYRYTL